MVEKARIKFLLMCDAIFARSLLSLKYFVNRKIIELQKFTKITNISKICFFSVYPFTKITKKKFWIVLLYFKNHFYKLLNIFCFIFLRFACAEASSELTKLGNRWYTAHTVLHPTTKQNLETKIFIQTTTKKMEPI